MKFEFHKSDNNFHDHSKAEAANWDLAVDFETVYGPTFTWIKLGRKSDKWARRLILYFPSGACWYFDLRRT